MFKVVKLLKTPLRLIYFKQPFFPVATCKYNYEITTMSLCLVGSLGLILEIFGFHLKWEFFLDILRLC